MKRIVILISIICSLTSMLFSVDVLIVFNPYNIDFQGDSTTYNPHPDDVLKVYKSTESSGPWTLHGSGVHTPSLTENVNFNFTAHQGLPQYRSVVIRDFPQGYYIKFGLDSYEHPSSYEFTADLNPQNFYVSDYEEEDFQSINELYFYTPSDYLMGDVNNDGILNVLDVVILVNIILENTLPTEYQLIVSDINSDEDINVLDVVTLVNIILQ